MQADVVNVYVTPDGETYRIPDEVMDKVNAASVGRSFNDRRTKAYRIIESWAESVEREANVSS